MDKLQTLPGAELSGVSVYLDIEGEAWGGFTAGLEVSRDYAPGEWPGARKVRDTALNGWGDVQRETAKATYGQIHYRLRNAQGWTQTIVRDFPAHLLAQ